VHAASHETHAVLYDAVRLVEPTFQSIIGAFQGNGRLIDDRAPVVLGGRAGFIDHTGQLVIAPRFDYAQHFVGGMPAPASVGRLEGLINRSGDWVVEPIYNSIQSIFGGGTAPESDSEFKGFLARRGKKYDILDHSGKKIISNVTIDRQRFGPSITSTFEHAYFPLLCPEGVIIGIVDKKPIMFARDGTPISPSQGELWWPLSCEGPYAVKIGQKFGYVDKALRPLTEAKFEAVGPFVYGLATVKFDGKYGLLRADGTWAIEPNFGAAQPLPNEKALVKAGDQAAIVDIGTGSLVMQTRFDDVCSLGRGIVGVMRNRKMGAVDEEGYWLFEPSYDPWAFNFFQDLIAVRSDGKWGFLDAAGNSIDAKFDEVRRFERGVGWAKTGDTWCPIDRRGNKISALACQTADPNPSQRPPPNAKMSCKIQSLEHPQQ